MTMMIIQTMKIPIEQAIVGELMSRIRGHLEAGLHAAWILTGTLCLTLQVLITHLVANRKLRKRAHSKGLSGTLRRLYRMELKSRKVGCTIYRGTWLSLIYMAFWGGKVWQNAYLHMELGVG
jgi:hypothetical protein